MKRAVLLFGVAVVLAGCTSNDAATPPVASESPAASPTIVEPSPTTPSQQPTTQAPTTAVPTPTKTSAQPGTGSFCTYLKETAGAQQQVEDPQQFVDLVEGAAAFAPGAIAEDLALYTQSVRKLALTVTGTAQEAAKADAWLTRNEDAVATAEANLNAYSESTCGMPFITGEG